jgi:hypothetical protein
MRLTLTLALAVSVAAPSFADEIVMKDGKTISWRSLVDQGQDYEVTTTDGKKITVHKAEIERVTVDPSGAPLAGATFTKIAGKVKTADGLKAIDPKRDVIAPNWCSVVPKGTELLCDLRNDAPTWIGVPVRMPIEYDFTMVLERSDSQSSFYVSLIGGGGTPFLVTLDDGGTSGIWGQKPSAGQVFPKGQKVTLEILVRKDSLSVRADEKEITVWRGKWAELALPPTHVPAKGKGLPFVGSQKIPGTVQNMWTIHRITFSTN